MISGSKQQLQQQLEYTLLKPDCHSWWISKMQSVREDTLEEQYAIKFNGNEWTKKNTQKSNIVPYFTGFWTSKIRHPYKQIEKLL